METGMDAPPKKCNEHISTLFRSSMWSPTAKWKSDAPTNCQQTRGHAESDDFCSRNCVIGVYLDRCAFSWSAHFCLCATVAAEGSFCQRKLTSQFLLHMAVICDGV